MLRFYKKSPICKKLFNDGCFKVIAFELVDNLKESQMTL